MHSKTTTTTRTRNQPTFAGPVTASAVQTADQGPPPGGRLSLPGTLTVIEAGLSRMEVTMRCKGHDRREQALRDALRMVEEEKSKLRDAELALADLLALRRPNFALLQAGRNGIEYQHKMIAKLHAEAEELAAGLDRPSLENRRALLVELARPPKRAVADPALTEMPEHLRPRRLDGSVAIKIERSGGRGRR